MVRHAVLCGHGHRPRVQRCGRAPHPSCGAPEVVGDEASSPAAAKVAVGEAMFHWGLQAWGIYAIVGLGLAYMTYRYGRPLSFRWLLETLMGRRLIESWVGHVIDTVAIIGTLSGVATSLGMGVLQIQAGLAHLGWVEPSNPFVIILVVCITAIGNVSVVSGVDKGIRWLSNTNMAMAGLLGLAVLIIGPTIFLLSSMVPNIGDYTQMIPQLAFVTGAGAEDGWTLAWTLFNQAWFLSWAPFVGMFIARISPGRTIREFILGVLLAPTAVSLVWLTIFGNSGLFYQLKNSDLVGEDGVVNTDTTLFQLFGELPVGSGMVTVLSVIAIIVIMLFFSTSADSCSLVVDVLSHGGRSETPRRTRVFWAVLVGLSGGVLLVAGEESALTVLQVSSLARAAPLSIVYALAMIAMWRVFRYEVAVMPRFVKLFAPTEASEESRHGLRELVLAHRPSDERREARRQASVSLAGLAPDAGSDRPVGQSSVDGVSVVAIQDLDPETPTRDHGALHVDKDTVMRDPIGGEVFDTPESNMSAAGDAHRSDRPTADPTGPL
ncbi:BCCT family transporter [Brevibacterium sediminis]